MRPRRLRPPVVGAGARACTNAHGDVGGGGGRHLKMAERKAFLLRLDPKIHDAVRRWADDDLRSVNAQIEYLLRRALEERGRLKSDRDA